MSNFKDLIGTTIKPDNSCNYTNESKYTMKSILVEKLQVAQNVSAVIVNGNYILSFTEVFKLLDELKKEA